MVPTNYHGEKMGLGTWKEEEIEILTPNGPITMGNATAQYGNPYFDVDRRVARSGMWERLAKALNIFQKKPYIQPDKCIRCGISLANIPTTVGCVMTALSTSAFLRRFGFSKIDSFLSIIPSIPPRSSRPSSRFS